MITAKEPPLMSFQEVQKILGGISKGSVYNLIRAGQLQKAKIGRRTLITTESLTDYLNRIIGPNRDES